MEQFKIIQNYETYKISNCGRVIDIRTGNEIKPYYNHNGYLCINLRNPEGQKVKSIHRLVGIHFLEKTDGKDEIDHIDRNKKNNHYTNLRWADDYLQAQNKENIKPTRTNERFISLEYKKNSLIPLRYKIQIIRNKKRLLSKSLNLKDYTLDDAIKIRDEFLKSIPK